MKVIIHTRIGTRIRREYCPTRRILSFQVNLRFIVDGTLVPDKETE